ncbi:related to WD-repeat protein 8 [Claviceps purpurea 20.1]|uniref:Related to WD-repeat protein 8 n=1 Tax=Claviceps purpurea (strain 20.1) TaxID=1111077 RepID=M1W4S4_CLAP2|nr:related to WD-repeat protein 8 [Claviceps purpurea 20.1]
MHHSRPFKSTSHCALSPDGLYVAVLSTSSSISIRSTKTLQIVHIIKLAPELTGLIGTVIWSPSSKNILISAGDHFQVSPARDSSFRAVISNPSAPLGSIPLIQFGATDWEVLTWAPFGLKLSVFDLASSRAVEINNPKFFQSASATRGFSIHPATGHLVVLTRVDGNDMVWQEQMGIADNTRTFLRAEKATSPQVVVESATIPSEARSGCSSMSFDASSTLLATRLDDSPFTIWIWDLAVAELRAALLFHSAVDFVWHPTSREVLLISCQGDERPSASYVWDPLSQGPKSLNVEQYLPARKKPSKLQISWLNHGSESPEILVSDSNYYVLLSLADTANEASPWEAAVGSVETSSLWMERDGAESLASASPIVIAEDVSKLDDTFSFKYN